jgi:stress response protein SCP2
VSKQFTKGQKSQLSALTAGTDLYVGVQLNAPGTSWDISCFGLDTSDKLSDDRYMVFYNQPKSPDGSIERLGEQSGDSDSFRVNLSAVPKSIGRLSFCAALDGNGTAAQIQSGYLRIVAGGTEVARFAFTGSDFRNERAVIIGDLYLKDVWRFGAVGQGFAGGLAELIRDFGGQVEEEQPAPASDKPGFAPPPGGAAPGFAPPPGPPPGQAPGFAPPPGPPPGQQPGFAPPPGQPAPPPGQPPAQPAYAQQQAPPAQPGYGQPPQPGYGQPPPAYGPPTYPTPVPGYGTPYGGYHGHYRQHGGYHGHTHHKRRKGFLSELFD